MSHEHTKISDKERLTALMGRSVAEVKLKETKKRLARTDDRVEALLKDNMRLMDKLKAVGDKLPLTHRLGVADALDLFAESPLKWFLRMFTSTRESNRAAMMDEIVRKAGRSAQDGCGHVKTRKLR